MVSPRIATTLADALGRDLPRRLAEDVRRVGAASPGDPVPDAPVVTESDVAALPLVVQRYFGFMGAVGRPRVWSLQGRFVGRFRLKPGQRWMACEAAQYNSAVEVARLFRMRVDVARRLPIVALDSYDHGEGHMRARLLGLVTVANGHGFEFDLGELTTYLNDAILYAPSMLLGRATTWTGIDEHTFSVALVDRGLTCMAQVTVDDRGAPKTFTTKDRFVALRGGLVCARWSTPVEAWATVAGRSVPRLASAVWDLPEGPFTYAEGALDPASIVWNATPIVPPPAAAPARPGVGDSVGGALRIAAGLATAPVLRRRTNHWGATTAEVAMAMTGDDIVPRARMASTRAITIAAPPAVVWSWLVQIGHGRGGLYSYDGLEDLVGCDLHSADTIREDLQHLAVGELVALGPEGYPTFCVERVDPPRTLTLVSADPTSLEPPPRPLPRGGTVSTWQWDLTPGSDGRSTRLVARQRYQFPTRMSPLWHLVEPIDFVMERRMLLGLKARAEHTVAEGSAAVVTRG